MTHERPGPADHLSLADWKVWRLTHYSDGTPRPDGPDMLLAELMDTDSGAQAVRDADRRYLQLKRELDDGRSFTWNSKPHEMTEACEQFHCFYHNVDEKPSRRKGAFSCGECWHRFQSTADLVWAYRKMVWGVYPPGLGRLWRFLTVRHSQIFHCPHCAHDF